MCDYFIDCSMIHEQSSLSLIFFFVVDMLDQGSITASVMPDADIANMMIQQHLRNQTSDQPNQHQSLAPRAADAGRLPMLSLLAQFRAPTLGGQAAGSLRQQNLVRLLAMRSATETSSDRLMSLMQQQRDSSVGVWSSQQLTWSYWK